MAEPLGAEAGAALCAQPQQVAEGGQEEQDGLGGQRFHAAHVELLLDQPVRREGEGQHQRDPRRPPVPDREHEHREEADADGRPLGPAQPLAEEQHADGDGDQRVDEVAEAGLDDRAVVDGPDVQAPVDGDHRGGQGGQAQLAGPAQQLPYPAPAAHGQQQGADDGQGPHHAVGEDLDGPGGLEERPEEGDQAPYPVCAESVEQPRALLAVRLHSVSRRNPANLTSEPSAVCSRCHAHKREILMTLVRPCVAGAGRTR